MTGPEQEQATFTLEVRSVDEPQRVATMLVCRYGETSRRTPKPERFAAGAFTRSVTSRGDKIAFTTRHTDRNGAIPQGTNVARPVSWDTSDPAELRAVLKFYDTPEGWEQFTRARGGDLDGASVGFKALEERTGPDGVREITEAALHHVAVFSRADMTPAYDAPRLVEVRSADVDRLLAVTYDIGMADQYVSADELRRMIHASGG